MKGETYEKLARIFEQVQANGLMVGMVKSEVENCISISIMTADKETIKSYTFDIQENTVDDIINGMDMLRKEVIEMEMRRKNVKH